MAEIISVEQIDLSPLPGKKYFDCQREWREEFIYFVLVDRFQDSQERPAASGTDRSMGFATQDDFWGGTLKGITNNLAYIAGLGCTAIWLSPVLEATSYHGYDTVNYLAIQPKFGSTQDLIDLVDVAHSFVKDGEPWPIRIILDVVINHSGDTWFYPGDLPYFYYDQLQFPFGGWREEDRPVPIELRNEDLYHRCGQMQANDWDTYPNNQFGDMYGDKDFANDDTANGSTLINILIKTFCYWIREADVDGFRMDAIKHMNPLACSRFSSSVREYAYALGKRNFFLFGEAATAADDVFNTYLGPNTSGIVGGDTIFFGIDSVLDFRLAEGLGSDASLAHVLKGWGDPSALLHRWQLQQDRALNHAELGRYLVTFVDNHDSFWQDGRFALNATDDQVLGGIGYCCARSARHAFTTARSRVSLAPTATSRCARACSTPH